MTLPRLPDKRVIQPFFLICRLESVLAEILQFLVGVRLVERDDVGQRFVRDQPVGQALQIGCEVGLKLCEQYLKFALSDFLPVNLAGIEQDDFAPPSFNLAMAASNKAASALGARMTPMRIPFKPSMERPLL